MLTPITPHSAAMIKTRKTKTLVIADLHIGWEMALLQKGIHVPTQTPRLLQKLKQIITTQRPEELVILGDVKHTVATARMSEWQDIPDFFAELKSQVEEIRVIRGNHDGNLEPLLPENITVLPASGTTVEDIGLFHGHRWPSPNLLNCKTLVMGHVHPTVAFSDPTGFRFGKQVWIKARCNGILLAKVLLQKYRVKTEKSAEETLWKHYKVKPKTTQLFIMPPFNDFLGSKPLNKGKTDTDRRMRGPVLRTDAVDMESAEIYLLDGTFLGNLGQLRSLS